MSRGRVEHEAKIDPKLSQSAPLEPPGAAPEAPGSKELSCEAIKSAPDRSWRPRGAEKNSLVPAGGGPENSQSEVSALLAYPGVDLGSILPPPGVPLGPLFGHFS